MNSSRKAAIVGGGVIGGGWAARFLLNGWDVSVFDPDPECERKINEVLSNARRSLPALYDKSLPRTGELRFCASLADAVAGACWVQESVPERLDIKHKVLADINAAASADAVIASSTSGFKPSEMTAHGARVIVAHPFNPVYLLPLVELVGDEPTIESAQEILRSVGMYPLHVRKEIDAHIADRLLEAVWREALWLVNDGVATTHEVDEAIRMGFGLRWAQMGLFETYRVAGGEAGMKHFMAQFGPALAWPWTKLMDVPEFTDELVDLIAGQSDDQSGHMSIRELERLRDDNLVGLLRSLKRTSHGAGEVISRHEDDLPEPQHKELPVTSDRVVPATWTDYNGHMNEAHYIEIGTQATDRFMALLGADMDYVKSGYSYFTVENHVRYLHEISAGERIIVQTQVLPSSGKKLHLFHFLHDENDQVRATMETLLLHTDMNTRRSCDPQPQVMRALEGFVLAQSHLSNPDGAGRHVGQSPG